ncbi:MAG: hypothetical protein AB1668_06995 [Nanoarchaeota archaeon]
MPIDYITERRLEDGTTLKLRTWESDAARPGVCPNQRMYLLELTGSCWTLSFSTASGSLTKLQAGEMYRSITSREGFIMAMNEERQRKGQSALPANLLG